VQQLKPLQVDLVERVVKARYEGARVIAVQAATGFGKNTVSAYFTRRSRDKGMPVLSIVHRRKLVDQISDRLHEWECPHAVLMRGETYHGYRSVVVASRDTLLSRCVDNDWSGMPDAKLVIVDEAHHAAAADSEYRRIIEYYRARGATIILQTATPVGPDGKGFGSWVDALVCAAPTTRLIREGYLLPLKCYAPDRKTVRGKVKKRGISGELVDSWKSYAEDQSTVLFTGRVKHSEDAVKAFLDAGIPAAHMDAETPDSVRDGLFDALASGRLKVLSNVGIVGEGVDVPTLGCCQLFCNVGSRVKLLQAAGRIMRLSPGKTHGNLIDHSGAVFAFGFPDEDTVWSLDDNSDDAFNDRLPREQAFYCKTCELAYHGAEFCPQCGRAPSKPPKSIFAPEPVKPGNQVLVEADRAGANGSVSREEKIQHWYRCLGASANGGGDFCRASAIYKNKYGEWPDKDFPCLPSWDQRRCKVKDIYPQFGKKVSA
jgi:DNA repair protein RadD